MLWHSQPRPQRENENLKLQNKRRKCQRDMNSQIVYEILTNVQKCTALLLVMLLVKLAILVKKVRFRGVRGGPLWAIVGHSGP